MNAKTPKTPKVPTVDLGDRAKQVLAPWGLAVAAMPVSVVLHAAWGGDAVMQELMAGGSVLLTGAVHTTWSRRHEHTRLLATVYTGLVTGWISVGTAVNPLSSGMVKAWEFGGALASIVWNIASAAHRAPHETDTASGKAGDLDLSTVGGALTGAVADKVRRKTGRLEADVQLKPGETAEGVEGERGRIASLAKVGADQVTVTPNRKRADRVMLSFSASPDQRKAVRGFVQGELGRSVADAPLVIGQRADGSDLAIWMVGNDDMDDPRALGHTLCTGMTGSGKTETINTLILRIRETCDMVPVVADPAKFEQSFGTIADALEIAAKGRQQTNALVRNLPAAITYRSELLGTLERSDGLSGGYSQWVPECWTLHRIPAVFVDIEEATDVLSTVDDEFDDAIRKARSVGIHLCASLQTAIHSNMERKTRGQFSNTLCHGCTEDHDAKFSLNANTLAAGADPTKWQNSYPGSLYGELLGVPPEEWSMDARAYGVERSEKRAAVDTSRPFWARLDPGTAMRLGAGIAMPDAKVVAGLTAVTRDPAPSQEEVSVYVDDDREPAFDPTRVSAEGGDIDVTTPIPAPDRDGPRVVLAPARTEPVDFEGAYRKIKLRLAKLEQGGQDHITYQDIGDIQAESGVSRGWMYKAMRRLEENGRLVAVSGAGKPPYRIVARERNGTAVG